VFQPSLYSWPLDHTHVTSSPMIDHNTIEPSHNFQPSSIWLKITKVTEWQGQVCIPSLGTIHMSLHLQWLLIIQSSLVIISSQAPDYYQGYGVLRPSLHSWPRNNTYTCCFISNDCP
jgi:hypothetical protein